MNNIIYLQWHIHVSAGLGKNKSTIHVTLATQVHTLDRPYKKKEKMKKKKHADNKLLYITNVTKRAFDFRVPQIRCKLN